MNLDSLLELINSKLIAIQSHPLNSAERLVLRGIWHDWSYNQITTQGGYSPGYLSNVVAPPLWQRLSILIDRRVTKKNCRFLLENYAACLNAEKMPPQLTASFSDHLQRLWAILQEQPNLALALCQVINNSQPVQLEPILAYKLKSMGLIKLYENKATRG